MALTKLLTDLDNVQALSDSPNETEGLTADQLKAKFDEAGNEIKTYINDVLTEEQDVVNATVAGFDTRITTAEGEIDTLQTEVDVLQDVNIIGVTYSSGSNFVINPATTFVQYPFNNIQAQLGTKLSLVSNEIVIGAGVSYIKASLLASVVFTATTSINYYIRKNDVVFSRGIVSGTTTSPTQPIALVPALIDVEEGDTIDVAFYATSGTTHNIGRNDLTQLIVEVVK